MAQSKLKTLAVTANESEAFQVNGKNIVVVVTTSESSAITLKTAADGIVFSTNTVFSETVDGTQEFNLTDFVAGQWVKVVATSGTMTACKILG